MCFRKYLSIPGESDGLRGTSSLINRDDDFIVFAFQDRFSASLAARWMSEAPRPARSKRNEASPVGANW